MFLLVFKLFCSAGWDLEINSFRMNFLNVFLGRGQSQAGCVGGEHRKCSLGVVADPENLSGEDGRILVWKGSHDILQIFVPSVSLLLWCYAWLLFWFDTCIWLGKIPVREDRFIPFYSIRLGKMKSPCAVLGFTPLMIFTIANNLLSWNQHKDMRKQPSMFVAVLHFWHRGEHKGCNVRFQSTSLLGQISLVGRGRFCGPVQQ